MLCKKCGNQLDESFKFCQACGEPVTVQQKSQSVVESPSKKRNQKKPFLIYAVALVLVVAIVLGAVFFSLGNDPLLQIFSAAQKTVFESSELTVNFNAYHNDNDYTKYQIKVTLGDDVRSSSVISDVEYTGVRYGERYVETYNYSYRNGFYYEDGKQTEDTINDLAVELEDELEGWIPYGTDLITEADKIINGKIDEDALESAMNTLIIPAAERFIADEMDAYIDLPEYKEIFSSAEDLLSNETISNALGIEKIKSDNPGKTYSYNINLAELARGFFECVSENEQYTEYFYAFIEDDLNVFASDVIEELNEEENIRGTVTIKSGRITHLTINWYEEQIKIEIES